MADDQMPRALLAALRLPVQTEEPPMPLPEAQAMELRQRWEALMTPSTLKPGDLCVEKQGLGNRAQAHRQNPYIVVRFLDLNDWLDRELVSHFLRGANLIGGDRFDCVVGMFQPGASECMKLHPHQLSQLERWEPPAASDTAPETRQ